MSQMTFYYGQLNFNYQITSDTSSTNVAGVTKTRRTIEEFIETTDPVFQQTDSQWYFGPPERANEVLASQFGKEFDYQRNTYEDGEFVDTGDSETDATFSWFVFDPRNGVIIFNQRNRIGYDQFRNAFVNGYNTRAQREAGVENALNMNWLTPRGELDRIISETRVTSARFTIPTNNMSGSGRASTFSQILTDSDSEKCFLEIKEATDDGLNFSEETMQRLVELVQEENNGVHVKLEYLESGTEETFNTQTNPATKSVGRPDNIQQLIAVSDQLLRRGQNISS